MIESSIYNNGHNFNDDFKKNIRINEMDTSLLIILITLAAFVVAIIAGYAKFYIREKGKEKGIEIKDIESGIDSAKDLAINELQKQKNNVKLNEGQEDVWKKKKE